MTTGQVWMWVISAGVVALTGVCAILIRRWPLHLRAWSLSTIFSLGCVAATGIIWYLVIHSPFVINVCDPLTNQQEIDKTLQKFPLSGDVKTLVIPTGVFIHSIEFSTANNALVTGYIWQKYPADMPGQVVRGVIFPEANALEMEEAYRSVQGNTELIGWRFSANIRQQYYFDQYPLDRQDIWLRIWSKDFEFPVVLVPDLAGYTTLIPEELPGLENYFVLENWDLKGSYFSICSKISNSNFGFPTYLTHNNFPELEFNVSIARNTLNSLLTFVAPPLITALMVFGILLISTMKDERLGVSGWNIATSLGFCSGLLLVIVFAQINLRDQLDAAGVIYLENLYFIVYFAILLVSFNAILFFSPNPIRFIKFEDNLIPKTLYWPLLTSIFLIITLFTFATTAA